MCCDVLRCAVVCCGLQADTVAFLQAVVAEGDADHLPSHIRAYRIAQLVKQKE
jgi:hypothetical protein